MTVTKHLHSNRMLVWRTKVSEDRAFRILYRLFPERVEEEGERIWCYERELESVLKSIECEC